MMMTNMVIHQKEMEFEDDKLPKVVVNLTTNEVVSHR